MHRLIAPRDQKHQSNFVEFRSLKIVYRRYAGLFFCVCVDANDNELAYLEAIHFFVEVLDSFFGNVCELDLVFNFYKVCFSFFSTALTGTPAHKPECDDKERRIEIVSDRMLIGTSAMVLKLGICYSR